MLEQNAILYFILFLSAIIGSYYLNGVINAIYLGKGLIDKVTLRSSHNSKVTRTGGIAIFLVIVTYSVLLATVIPIIQSLHFWIALGLIILLGALDDIFTLSYKQKFIFQLFTGLILTQSGYLIDSFHGVFGIYDLPYLVAVTTSIVVYIVIVNAMNLIDGIDGLSSFLFLFPVSVIGLFIWGVDIELFILIPIIIGSVLAFLYFNLSRHRKVFLGDSGSLLVGTLLCFFIFWFLKKDHNIAIDTYINRGYLATLLLIYPLTDTLRAFTLRILKRKSPFSADRIHLHHRLLNKGYTHLYASLMILMLSLLILIVNLLWFNFLGIVLAPIATILLMTVIFYYFF